MNILWHCEMRPCYNLRLTIPQKRHQLQSDGHWWLSPVLKSIQNLSDITWIWTRDPTNVERGLSHCTTQYPAIWILRVTVHMFFSRSGLWLKYATSFCTFTPFQCRIALQTPALLKIGNRRAVMSWW